MGPGAHLRARSAWAPGGPYALGMSAHGRLLAPVLAAAGTLALAGCGGGSDASASGEDGVRGALSTYASAVSDGDGEAVCGVLTKASQAGVTRLAGGSCATAIGTLVGDVGDVEVDVGDVRLDGDSAQADITQTARGRDAEQTVTLRREDGAWRLSQPQFEAR